MYKKKYAYLILFSSFSTSNKSVETINKFHPN